LSRDTRGRFQTGGKPGPGRPPGSRNRLAENFIAALSADWAKNGVAVIGRVRKSNPSVYLKIIAGIIPRDSSMSVDWNVSQLTDEELLANLEEAVAIGKLHCAQNKGG